MSTETPMLKQYKDIKAKYSVCILFYRLGDFYEMFYDDAKEASAILDLVLTSRGKGAASQVPMCGLPFHASENYIAKLIKAGKKVAICEQVEDPATAKGIVKRDVIRVITSGTYIDENNTAPRFLLCLFFSKKGIGFSFTDPANGTIYTNQSSNKKEIIHITAKLTVYECIFPIAQREQIKEIFSDPLLLSKKITMSPCDDWCFNTEIAEKNLCEHFGTHSLCGYNIEEKPFAIAACGALLEYLKTMNNQPLRHIDKISVYSDTEHVFISPAACYGLELENLLATIDSTITPLGKRMFRSWLYHPLKNTRSIIERQNAVEKLLANFDIKDKLSQLLQNMPDIEKHLSRISCGYTSPRDLLALRNALTKIPDICNTLRAIKENNELFQIEDIPDLRLLFEKTINPELPLSKPEGKVICAGYNAELDSYKDIQQNGKKWLSRLQKEQIEKTGINSLKIGFNKVFGYYIEVSKTNLRLVPETFIRKQTLVNAERFITPELKEFEEKMLNAESHIIEIENKIIVELCGKVLDESYNLHKLSVSVANIDTLISLTTLAQKHQYIKPEITNSKEIIIKDGRHPVVEQYSDAPFIPNDTLLDNKENHLLIITGPNMAGKSTYIRQTAILVIMAQIGSYIPASEAKIGIVDKIFTRIGAHDEISKGQSTFMVEMSETAGILNNLSERSLVILDEIGRGTSTFDGLSLAWSVAEYLEKQKVRTLFATHFHEITVLEDEHPGVKNYNVSVKEWQDEIIFLHKILRGNADDSYGIYVAKLAGVPKQVVDRAKKILARLEANENLHEKVLDTTIKEEQLPLFNAQTIIQTDPFIEKVCKKIETLDIDTLTPIQALTKLYEIKEMLSNNVTS